MNQDEKRRYAADVLRKAEAKRGYLLPYHKMLGTDDPARLEAYDGFYKAFTLDARSFTDKEREVVWAALLVAGEWWSFVAILPAVIACVVLLIAWLLSPRGNPASRPA